MIRASFSERGGVLCGFRISGHSGYAEAGGDIVCAAVSAMAMLTVNMLADAFGLKCGLKEDAAGVEISFRLEEPLELGGKVLSAFRNELLNLSKEYPQNILVKEK